LRMAGVRSLSREAKRYREAPAESPNKKLLFCRSFFYGIKLIIVGARSLSREAQRNREAPAESLFRKTKESKST